MKDKKTIEKARQLAIDYITNNQKVDILDLCLVRADDLRSGYKGLDMIFFLVSTHCGKLYIVHIDSTIVKEMLIKSISEVNYIEYKPLEKKCLVKKN